MSISTVIPALRSFSNPASADKRVGILHRRHNTGDTPASIRAFDARACAADVRARFERHIDCGPSRLVTGLPKRFDLGVVYPFPHMMSATDDLAIAHDDGADRWDSGWSAGALHGFRQRLAP